eukprot:m.133002 g.133002  ORF g.133002 m.133002 type:complete len:1491 (+) comp38095_c0_seq2:109-4581(+)
MKGFLDSQRTFQSRLKLAHFAWRSNAISCPNKHQALLDWFCNELVARSKKGHIAWMTEDAAALWRLYENALSSIVSKGEESRFIIKHNIVQVLTSVAEEALQNDHFRNGCCLQSALRVVKMMFDSPSLSQLLVHRFESYAPFTVVFAKLAIAVLMEQQDGQGCDEALLLNAMLSVLKKYVKLQGKQANSKKVFLYTCKNMLFPYIQLRKCLALLKDTVIAKSVLRQLDMALSGSLFHPDHTPVYISAIDSGQQQLVERDDGSEKTSTASYCKHLFSAIKEAVLQYPDEVFLVIPVFFSSYLLAARNQNKQRISSAAKFQFMTTLCRSSDILNEDPNGRSQTVQLDAFHQLMSLLNSSNVYNVAADSSAGGHQLEWLKEVAWCLTAGEWTYGNHKQYICLEVLVSLNHHIIDDCVISLWKACFDPSKQCDLLSGLLSFILDIYNKLSQVHVLLAQVLKIEGMVLRMPLPIIQKFGEVFQLMSLSHVEEVWRVLASELGLSCAQKAENLEDEASPPRRKKRKSCSAELKNSYVSKAWPLCRLLCLLMAKASLASPALSHKETIAKLLQETIRDALASLTFRFNVNKEPDILLCCLHLQSSLFDVFALLNHLQPGMANDIMAELPSLVWMDELGGLWPDHLEQPDGDVKEQPRAYYLLGRLSVQYIRQSLCSDEEQRDLETVRKAVAFLCGFPKMSADAEAVWDGEIDSIDQVSLPLACWRLLADSLPVLIPLMTSSEVSLIAGFIVSSFKGITGNSLISVGAISYSLLASLTFQESKRMQSALVTAFLAGLSSSIRPLMEREKEGMDALNVLDTMLHSITVFSDSDKEVSETIVSLASTGLASKGIKQKFRGLLESRWSSAASQTVQIITRCVKSLNKKSSASSQCVSMKDSLTHLLTGFGLLPLDFLSTENFVMSFLGLLLCGAGLLVATHWLPAEYFSLCKCCLQTLESVDAKKFSICFDVIFPSIQPILHLFSFCYDLQGFCQNDLRVTLAGLASFSIGKASLVPGVLSFAQKVTEVQFLDEPATALNVACSIFDACFHVGKRQSDEGVHSSCGDIMKCLCQCLRQNLMDAITGHCQVNATVETCLETFVLMETAASALKMESCVDKGVVDFAVDYLISPGDPDRRDEVTEWCVGVLWAVQLQSCRKHFASCWTVFSHLLQSNGGNCGQRRQWSSLASIVLDCNVAEVRRGSSKGDCVNFAIMEKCFDEMLRNAGLEEVETILENLSDDTANCCQRQNTDGMLRSAVFLWEVLLTAKYQNDDIRKAVFRRIPQAISSFLEVIQIKVKDVTCFTENVLSKILSLLSQFLLRGKMVLSGGASVSVLHACLMIPLSAEQLKSYYEVLHMLLHHHSDSVVGAVAPLIQCVKKMLSYVLRSEIPGECDVSVDSLNQRQQSGAYLLSRLYQEISRNKSFGKYIPHMISDYIALVQKEPVGSEVKQVLLPGIYAVMDLCKDHEMALLHATLDKPGKELFKKLHEEYSQHHKYKGKV